MIKCIEKWDYLFNKFQIYTDANNIEMLFKHYNKPKPSARHYRWCLNLSQYKMDVNHIAGKANSIADYLSRYIDHNKINNLSNNYQLKHEDIKNNPFELEYNDSNNITNNTLILNAHSFLTLRNGKKTGADKEISMDKQEKKQSTKLILLKKNKKQFIEKQRNKKLNKKPDEKKPLLLLEPKPNLNNNVNIDNNNNNCNQKHVINEQKMDNDILIHDEKIEVDAELSKNKQILNKFETFDYNEPKDILTISDKSIIDNSMFDKQRLLDEQCNNDIIIQLIRKWLNAEIKDVDCYNLHPNIVHDLRNDKYQIFTNNLLYHLNEKINKWVMVIPNEYKYKYIKYMHDSRYVSIHASKDKLIYHIKQYIYWPGIDKDIKQYIEQCQICQVRGAQLNKNAGKLRPFLITKPWDTLQLDIGGTLPLTFNGNEFFLIMRDMNTGYVEIAPLPDIKSITICKTIYNYWISRHGEFKQLLSDNGTQLTSQLTHTFSKQFNIKQKFTTPYHPQCDGGSERMVQEIKRGIKLLHYDYKQQCNRWDEYLPLIRAKINNTIQRSTKLTPNELVYGRKINHTLDYKLDLDDINNMNNSDKIKDEIDWYQYMQSIINRIETNTKKANKNRVLYNNKMKKYYDKNKKHVVYKKDTYVWYYIGDKTVKKNMFLDIPKWRGPFLITKVWNDGLNYEISIPEENISMSTNISKLKPFKYNDKIYDALHNHNEYNSDFSEISNLQSDIDSIVPNKDNDSDYIPDDHDILPDDL